MFNRLFPNAAPFVVPKPAPAPPEPAASLEAETGGVSVGLAAEVDELVAAWNAMKLPASLSNAARQRIQRVGDQLAAIHGVEIKAVWRP